MEWDDIIQALCTSGEILVFDCTLYLQRLLVPLLYIGPVIIVNLQDITTQNDLQDNNAVFTFDVLPRISPDVTLGFCVHSTVTSVLQC